MLSFSSWQRRKITGNRSLVTDVLKDRMGFGGFTVSDWNAHGQVEGCTNASCPQALLAGLDMYMAPDSWKPIFEDLLARAKAGTVPMARIDDAVRRSEAHTSELQSLMRNSYAVFCFKKKKYDTPQ